MNPSTERRAKTTSRVDRVPSNFDEKRLEEVLDTITAPRIESLEEPKRSYAGQLREIFVQPNVVGVGISEKITESNNTGQLCLTFYVEKKLPTAQLTDSEIVPQIVPAPLSGKPSIPTDVIELGIIRLQKTPPFVQKAPIQPGNSVGHFKTSAGTLGAIVKRGKQRMILSNSHVLALSGRAKKGDAILYPAKADKGKRPGDVIAKLNEWVPFTTGGEFVNEVDCAVATLSTIRARPVNSCMRGLKAPKGIIAPRRRMKVLISGRTSGVSSSDPTANDGVPSRITDTHFRFNLTYPDLGKSVGFKNQVLCRPPYSQDGDSGSLVIDKQTSQAVGLHFAGTSKGSVFSPIKKVLSKLRCTLELAGTAKQGKKAKKKGGKT